MQHTICNKVVSQKNGKITIFPSLAAAGSYEST